MANRTWACSRVNSCRPGGQVLLRPLDAGGVGVPGAPRADVKPKCSGLRSTADGPPGIAGIPAGMFLARAGWGSPTQLAGRDASDPNKFTTLLSHLYEAKIKNLGNAGRNGGEYYPPRPLIRAIVN